MNNKIYIVDRNGNQIIAEGISLINLKGDSYSNDYLFYTLNEVVNGGLNKIYVAKVNEDDTVTILRNFNISEFTYSNSDLNNVERDKIAPGSSGEFVLRIKPNDTEVSIKYTINSHIVDSNFALKYYVKGPGDNTRIEMPQSGYVGYINYDASHTNYEEVITFYVDWLNDESANEKDTQIGTKSVDPKLEIPVEITFEQYNG